jgi:hypothetical protein
MKFIIQKISKQKNFSKYKWSGWAGQDGLVGLMSASLLWRGVPKNPE